MRTVLAAVLVGCASAAALADAKDQYLDFSPYALGAGVGVIEMYPLVEPVVPPQAQSHKAIASITPGTIALTIIALGGVALGKLSGRKSGVSTLGPVRR